MRTDRLTNLKKKQILDFRSCTNAPNKTYSRCAVVRRVTKELPFRRVNSQKMSFIIALKESNL